MFRINYFIIFSLVIIFRSGFLGTASCNSPAFVSITKDLDSLSGKQNLYNGRVWRDIYSHRVTGDQFLFSKEFIPGSVRFSGRSYKNIRLRYDICNDEVLMVTDQNVVLQLNKEMVDMFTLEYGSIIHQFKRLENDSINSLKGYVDVLYSGSMELYVKYIKEISRLTQGRISDFFLQTMRVYVRKDGVVYQIDSKKDFISLLSDEKQQIRNYMKTNKIKVSKKIPESFVKVLKFYDSLSH